MDWKSKGELWGAEELIVWAIQVITDGTDEKKIHVSWLFSMTPAFSQKEVHDNASKMSVFKIILLFNLFVAVITWCMAN